MIEITKAIVPPTPPYVLAIGNSIGGNTSGGILFGNSANNLAQNSTSLFWDAVNSRLGIGQNVPTARVHIKGSGSTSATNSLLVTDSGGNTVFKVLDNGGISSGTSTASGTNNSVALGNGVTASGQSAIALGGPNGTTASGTYSIAIGRENLASNTHSVAIGNFANSRAAASLAFGNYSETDTNANYSTALPYSKTTMLYQQAQGSQFFSNSGNALFGSSQITNIVIGREAILTTGATTILSSDKTGVTGLVIPPTNDTFWNVEIRTVATVILITGTATGVNVGDAYSEVKNLCFKRFIGTSALVGTVDTSFVKSDLSMATAFVTITAGASQEMKTEFTAPTFVGGGSVTIRVVSSVKITQTLK